MNRSFTIVVRALAAMVLLLIIAASGVYAVIGYERPRDLLEFIGGVLIGVVLLAAVFFMPSADVFPILVTVISALFGIVGILLVRWSLPADGTSRPQLLLGGCLVAQFVLRLLTQGLAVVIGRNSELLAVGGMAAGVPIAFAIVGLSLYILFRPYVSAIRTGVRSP